MKKKSPQTALESLKAANRLLCRDKWIECDLALDRQGEKCSPRSPKAVYFCALGAVRHVDGPAEADAVGILRSTAASILKSYGAKDSSERPCNEDIFMINDEYGYREVKNMFKQAIKAAKDKH